MTKFFIMTALLLGSVSQAAQITGTKWESFKKKDGIEFFISEDDIKGTSVKGLRSNFVVDKNIGKVLGYLSDANNATKWSTNIVNSKVLEKNENKVVVYRKYKKNWPFKTRDLVYQIRPSVDINSKSLLLNFSHVEHALAPKLEEGVHRGKMLTGHIKLTAIELDKTQVEFITVIDFGGWIPDFASLRKQKEMLTKNMVLLKSQLANQELPLSDKHHKLSLLFFR